MNRLRALALSLALSGSLTALVAGVGAVGLTVALSASGCVHAPPSLNPAATQAFYVTRAEKALNILRDTAIDGSRTTPPVVSRPTAETVVRWHLSAIRIMHALGSGWQATVNTSLDELLRGLSPADRVLFAPYAALARAVIQEIP